MLPWDNLARDLASRARASAEEHEAQARALEYNTWARRIVEVCLEDLEAELHRHLARFDEPVRRSIGITNIHPQHSGAFMAGGVQQVMCVHLAQDQVHIHVQWQPGAAPTVHLLWSRRRQRRYCQLVPVTGGRLLPESEPTTPGAARRLSPTGYRIRSTDPSGDELTREALIYRALGLLAVGTRH